jgi:hypothetical protein
MKTKVCVIVLMILLMASINAFALESPLKTEEVADKDVQGVFTLILYGGRYYDDVETVAIIDLEKDKYTFDVFAPEFDYTVKKGVPAKEALEAAKKFVSFHHAFYKSIVSKILDNKGNIIGYEVRPLYRPIVYGISDVLDVYYWPKEGNKIKVTIRLTPSIEKLRFPGGGGDGGGGGGGS